ncbi:MAG: AAA family ATPase [Chloroflexota bacterium]|nr:AAA family ATPase [Chloroflexota bacterium]
MAFRKATKSLSRARLTLDGPAGSGKTDTALAIAYALAAAEGKRFVVIDTEHHRANLFAHKYDFDEPELDLTQFDPDVLIELIHEAEAEPEYAAIVLDSLTHWWAGAGGVLDQVDQYKARNRFGNQMDAWREVGTPKQTELVETILQSRLHVIGTMRTKTAYEIEQIEVDGKKKTKVQKVGLAPVQRDGIEYEFDLIADLDLEHRLVVTKSRFEVLDGAVIRGKSAKEVGAEVAKRLLDSLADAQPEQPRVKREVVKAAEVAPEPSPEPEPECPGDQAVAAAKTMLATPEGQAFDKATDPPLYGSAPPPGNPTHRALEEQKAAEQRAENVIDHPAKAAVEAFQPGPGSTSGELEEEPWEVVLGQATVDQGKWFVRKVKDTWSTITSADQIGNVLKDGAWRKSFANQTFEEVYGRIKAAIDQEDMAMFMGKGGEA